MTQIVTMIIKLIVIVIILPTTSKNNTNIREIKYISKVIGLWLDNLPASAKMPSGFREFSYLKIL